MQLKILLLAFFCSLLALPAQADEGVASVQRTLKEQGFYYGEITGKKDADTSAALRRYQIRNGLKITGDLDAETQKSLGGKTPAAVAASTPNRVPHATSSPVRRTTTTNRLSPPPGGNDSRVIEEATPPPVQREYRLNEDEQFGDNRGEEDLHENEEPAERAPVPALAPPPAPTARVQMFSDTPYETAPAPVQRQVVLGAQTLLARRGIYRSSIDGVYGPGMEFAVRAYQARVGLPPNGRLDMDTLASLGLLPGQRMPAARVRRRSPIPPGVVRGEWVPEN